MKPINEAFMEAGLSLACQGLITTVHVVLQPGMPLYRFADSSRPHAHLTGGWWVGYSPFQALKEHAARRNQTLSAAARQCLAVDFGWSKLDVLYKTVVEAPLAAWAGTPQTQRVRQPLPAGGDRRWEPDREITQLYIPGLGQPAPKNPHQQVWQLALRTPIRLPLVA
jgi:hypothetical protein